MKMIEAIIQPARLEAVKDALCEVGVVRLTVSDVEGLGGKEKRTETFRGQEYTVDTVRRVKLEIAVNESFVEPTVESIVRAGRGLLLFDVIAPRTHQPTPAPDPDPR